MFENISKQIEEIESRNHPECLDSARTLLSDVLELHRVSITGLVEKLREGKKIDDLLRSPEFMPLVEMHEIHLLDKCELCSEPIGESHSHLFDTKNNLVVCSCKTCSLLFPVRENARFTFIEDKNEALTLVERKIIFDIFKEINMPIKLAFLQKNKVDQSLYLYCPSPGGLICSDLDSDIQNKLNEASLAIKEIIPNHETIIFYEKNKNQEAFLVSMNKAFELQGLIQKNWTGMSGGDDLWDEVNNFFFLLRNNLGTDCAH